MPSVHQPTTPCGHVLCQTCRNIATTLAPILLLFSGCARQPILEPLDTLERTPAQTYAWECERNFAFVARREGDAMWLFLPGHAVQLPRIEDSSGDSYRGKDIRFLQNNGQAQLTLPNQHYEHCQNNRQRAAWENARLNGVDFRASGNAPDWILELTLDGDMQLLTGTGHKHYDFPTPEPVVLESARKTLYSAQNKSHQIIVELNGTPCRDPITGEPREVTVNISLDNRLMKGCGSALH